MNIKDNKKLQMIVLGCLLVLAIAYGAFKLMGTGTQAAPPARETEAVETKSATPAVVPVTTGTTEGMLVASSEARDPFMPQVGPKVEQIVQNTAVSRQNIMPMINLPRVPIFPITPTTSGPGPAVSASVPESDPLSELKVTGVIVGTTNVAIIRGPEGERHYVREGDFIGGKYQIVMISPLGVNVRSGNRITVLRLGGNDGVRDRVKA